MKDGSYIWNATVEYRWGYEVENGEDENTQDFVVAASDFEKACLKVVQVFMKNNKPWKNKEGDVIKTHSIKEMELIKVERGDWIDG